MSTVVSSGSFTIAPEKSGSSILINAKPVPFTATSSHDKGGLKNTLTQGYNRNKNKGDHGYQNGNFYDCFFGKNCPQENPIDDWRTYYSVLNGIDKPYSSNGVSNHYTQSFNHKYGFSDDDLFPLSSSSDEHSSFPFVVSGNPHHRNKPFRQHSNYPFNRYPDTTRRSRTTTPSTSSPSWVKLEPVLPAKVYDPFFLSKKNETKNETGNSSSQFASRVGVELNPETFAERHGWKDGKIGTGGSRLPSWLEALNYQHGGLTKPPTYDTRPNNPDRNDDDWVKLDAIPVAGVSISKWVPKGTSPSELPSTNWPDQSKPNAWWDRIDNLETGESYPPRQQSRPRPSYANIPDPPWPSRYPQERPQYGNKPHQHHPSEGWGDVIYPDNNPVSATASWDADKGGSSSPWANNYNSNKHSNRYPVASWSAAGSKTSHSSSNMNNAYDYGSSARRPSYSVTSSGKPPFYPDPNGHKNDPRWVLVSSSKGLQPSSSKPNINYDPDFPYPYQNMRHRMSKEMNLTNILGISSSTQSAPSLSQDELFRRTNATLYSLQPVLGQRQFSGTTESPGSISQTLIDIVAQTGANIVASSTEKYFGKGRAMAGNNDSSPSSAARKSENVETKNQKRHLLNGINPIYAAVGAGLIPATLAAVLPVALGRKKRETGIYGNRIFSNPWSIYSTALKLEDQLSPVLNEYLLHKSSYPISKFMREGRNIGHKRNWSIENSR